MWRQIWGTDCRRTTWTHASYSASMSCHFVFEEKVVRQHPLLCGFMRDARLKLLKLWPPFEALEQGDLKVMTAMLLSLQSAKCVGEIHAPCAHQAGPGLSSGSTNLPDFLGVWVMFFKLLSIFPAVLLRWALVVTHAVSSALLYVPWPKNHVGKPDSMPRLSHWIDKAIAKLTEGLHEHSTKGLGASWQICVAASWVTP